MFILVFIGGFAGALLMGVLASGAIADAQAHVERLKDALRDVRSVETRAVVRDERGRFAGNRPGVQG